MAVEGFSRNSFSTFGGFHRKPSDKEARVVNHILDVPPQPAYWLVTTRMTWKILSSTSQPKPLFATIAASRYKAYFPPKPPGCWNQPSRFGANLLTRGIGWRYVLGFEKLWGVSKKSPTGPTERTPKPEYLLVIAQAPYLGVRW